MIMVIIIILSLLASPAAGGQWLCPRLSRRPTPPTAPMPIFHNTNII
jgi:hypothetical protein